MFASIAALTCLLRQDTSESIFRHWIETLNSLEITKMTAFAAAHTSAPPSASERAQRMMGVAKQGAPFKIVRIARADATEVRAELEDAKHMRLGAVMRFGPGLKVLGVLLQDPESIDAPPPKDYSGWKSLAGLAEAVRRDANSPAIGLAVIRGGKLEQAVSGMRSVGGSDPVRPSDPWSIGSIGKPICTSVIGALVERGKLRWNMPLGEALKGIPMRPEYAKVTLEQVMHHRGGIPQDLGFRKETIDRIAEGAKTPTEMRSHYARDILSRPMVDAPGKRFAYSNAGFALLAVAAERATGRSYEELVRSLVFKPLGMTNSYIDSSTFPNVVPSGHMDGPGGLRAQNFRGVIEWMNAGAGGGIYLSVADLARFGEAHLRGLQGKDGFLKAATIRHLHQGIPEGGPDGGAYACGWGIRTEPGLPLSHGHNGSNGTFRAELAIYPKNDLVVAAIINRGGESDPSPCLQAVMAVGRRYTKP